MKSVVKISLAALALSLLVMESAHADIADIRAADRSVEFDVGAISLKYGETSPSMTDDTEKGAMPAVRLGFTYLGNDKTSWKVFRNFYVDLSAQGAFGQTEYNGYLQEYDNNGNLVALLPWNSTTNDEIFDASLKLGRAFPLSSQVMFIPFGDFGVHYWHRQSTGTGGYSEDYTIGNTMFGLKLQYSPFAKWVFSAWGEGGTTISPTLKANLDGSSYTFDLGSEPIYEFDARASYAFATRWALSGTFSFKGFGYGMSSMNDGAYEPDSYTHQATGLIGISYLLR